MYIHEEVTLLQKVLNAIGKTMPAYEISYFTGKSDDVRLYSRALPAGEVRQLYNIGANTKVAATAKYALTSGLIGWWTFDGPKMLTNVADSSGQGNTGYLSHGGSGTTTVAGKLGQGLSFDGTDDYVSIPYQNLNFERTDSFSFSAWVKFGSGFPSGDGQSIIGRTNGSNKGTWFYWANSAVASVQNAK